MSVVPTFEVAEGAQKRVGGGLAPGAQRGLLGHLGQILQEHDVALLSPSLGDLRQGLAHLPQALAAGRTLAARFTREEVDEVPGDVNHERLTWPFWRLQPSEILRIFTGPP